MEIQKITLLWGVMFPQKTFLGPCGVEFLDFLDFFGRYGCQDSAQSVLPEAPCPVVRIGLKFKHISKRDVRLSCHIA